MNPYHVAQYIHNVEALTVLADKEDADGILTIINEKTINKSNSELQTINALILTLGEQSAGIAAGVLKAAAAQNPLLDAIYVKFCSTGIDLSDDRTQAMIDILFASSIPVGMDGDGQPIMFDLVPLGQAIKAMGAWAISEAESRFGRNLTAEDIPEVLTEYKRILLGEKVVTRFNNLLAAIQSGDITTEQAAIAKFGE